MNYFRPLADQGVAEAQFVVGAMYKNGQGVPQDYVLAHMWFNLASSRAQDAEVRDVSAKSRDEVAETDRFPRAPRLDPLRSALAKLEPATASKPTPHPKPPPPAKADKRARRRRAGAYLKPSKGS